MSDFVKAKKKSALLVHLKNAADDRIRNWRRELLESVVTHDELLDWSSGGGTDHGTLSGLTDDDHALYLLASAATNRATFATNWTDLTDAGQTSLHTHAASGGADTDAIHDNVDEEIYDITEKTGPTGSDLVIIEDAADGYSKKSVQLQNLPIGNVTGGGTDISIDFEDDEGYVTPNDLTTQGDWDNKAPYAQYWLCSEQTPTGGGIEGAALKNNTTSSGGRALYNAASWTDGTIDVYYRIEANVNQFSGIWIGDNAFSTNGIYFGIVTAAGGVTTGFWYNSIGFDVYSSQFGSVNGSTPYWIRAQVDVDGSYGRMKGWSGNIGDEPGVWGVERGFGSAIPTPLYLGLHAGTTSNSASFATIFQVVLTNPEQTGSTLGEIDHGDLEGLGDDDHASYLLASDATDRSTFATNWTDLTDTGYTTLHKHTEARTAAVPSSVTLNTGTHTGGTVSDVGTSLDGNTYDVDEVTGTPGFDIQFDWASGVTAIHDVYLRFSYVGTATHVVELLMYNYNTTTYDTITRISISGGGRFRWHMIPVMDDTNYISSGASRIKIYHTTAGNASHDISIDYVALVKYGTT